MCQAVIVSPDGRDVQACVENTERGISPDMAQLDHMKQRVRHISGVGDEAGFGLVVGPVHRQPA